MAELLRAPNSNSGVSDQKSVGLSPSRDTCVLSKTLNSCFVLRTGRKAAGPVCCVIHVNDPCNTYRLEKGFAQCSWQRLLIVPLYDVIIITITNPLLI